MVKYLMINRSSRFIPYDEKYRIFATWESAEAAMKELGLDVALTKRITNFDLSTGMMNRTVYGDFDISVIALEEEGLV